MVLYITSAVHITSTPLKIFTCNRIQTVRQCTPTQLADLQNKFSTLRPCKNKITCAFILFMTIITIIECMCFVHVLHASHVVNQVVSSLMYCSSQMNHFISTVLVDINFLHCNVNRIIINRNMICD